MAAVPRAAADAEQKQTTAALAEIRQRGGEILNGLMIDCARDFARLIEKRFDVTHAPSLKGHCPSAWLLVSLLRGVKLFDLDTASVAGFVGNPWAFSINTTASTRRAKPDPGRDDSMLATKQSSGEIPPCCATGECLTWRAMMGDGASRHSRLAAPM